MADALFVYGTLRDQDVCTRLLGRMPKSAPALLHGHVRLAVRGEPYPAIVPDGASNVRGLLLAGLSAAELVALDCYEGDEYRRIEVSVETDAGQARAWVYVWAGCGERLCAGGCRAWRVGSIWRAGSPRTWPCSPRLPRG